MHGFLRSPGGSATSSGVVVRHYDLRSRGNDLELNIFNFAAQFGF